MKNIVILICLRILPRSICFGFSGYIRKIVYRNAYYSEKSYNTADNRQIVLYDNYRYSIKQGWRAFSGLNILSGLQVRGKLRRSEELFLEKAKGKNTIAVPIDETLIVAAEAIRRNPDLFLPFDLDLFIQGRIIEFRPGKKQLLETINVFRRRHNQMFNRLAAAGIFRISPGASILEIGYSTGGHSIFAFELLGFEAFGIDNYYAGILCEQSLHSYCREMLSSRALFYIGDITRTTNFASESMDVVFSTSVLEHIRDLESAFVEMFRLLKPGGAIIHNYSPYFSHDGGHALGIGDAPWLHVRLNEVEYLKYLKEMRPYEYETAQKWMTTALHRDMPQWKVQRLIINSGFNIVYWVTKSSPSKWLADLTPDIIFECFSATPEIGLNDLISQSISFVAIKN